MRTIVLNKVTGSAQLSDLSDTTVEFPDLKDLKEIVEFFRYLVLVDPKFNEYFTAFKAKQRILR